MFGRTRRSTPPSPIVARLACLLVALALVSLVGIRSQPSASSAAAETSWQEGTPITGAPSVTESVAGLMRAQRIADRSQRPPVHPKPEPDVDSRRSLPENPGSPKVSRLPGGAPSASTALSTPQTVGP